MSSEDAYDAYMDKFGPSVTPRLAHVVAGMATAAYNHSWPEMTVLAEDCSSITIRGRVFVPPTYRDDWRVVLSTFEDVTAEHVREPNSFLPGRRQSRPWKQSPNS